MTRDPITVLPGLFIAAAMEQMQQGGGNLGRPRILRGLFHLNGGDAATNQPSIYPTDDSENNHGLN
jgi:hypothetical protein